ncbi:hypothetical protein [Arsenicicoccus sp. oral taxon 190]|uniref:hypothetical protein n=1 Tax=Arsenicicoccus sp. oral taxon 190 TaxID=1658671 RepID=UPI00067A06C2|nr:hypothetical protein [Arsenicicoccus sp. oral taxon 190]AKT52222.1 hypothetical protein ADJ73_14785 [Arsenicicoccus sp. oral taxon 190]
MTDNSTPTLTDEQRDQIRNGAFGAIALVSKADPGFLAMFKESMAGSKTLASAPADVRELLAGQGLPTPPSGSPEEVESAVLRDLAGGYAALRSTAPGQAQGYRDVVLAACDQVAQASGGVAPTEQAVIEKIRGALTDQPQA